jgi:hypothetical protein
MNRRDRELSISTGSRLAEDWSSASSPSEGKRQFINPPVAFLHSGTIRDFCAEERLR